MFSDECDDESSYVPPASQDDPQVRYEAASESDKDAGLPLSAHSQASHTSLDTNYSESQRRDSRPRSASTSSSSSSSSSASYGSSPKSDSNNTERQNTPPPKTPPAMRPLRRRDTFFDQKRPSQDFASVIDSLSQTTDRDMKERETDFDSDKPMSREPSREGPILRQVSEEEEKEMGRLSMDDVKEHNKEQDSAARLTLQDVGEEEKARKAAENEEEEQEKYLAGFKVRQ